MGKTREVGLFEIKNLKIKKRMLFIEHSGVKILTKEFDTNIG